MFEIGELPRAAWRSIGLWTVSVTLASTAASMALSVWLLDVLSQGINGPGLIAAAALPILLGGPMMFYHTLRHQQLKLANVRLDILASTDPLTDCLNRRAFTARASRLLERHREGGALIVVDADHFKTVNDRFGHQAGDVALRLIADAIVASVRGEDIVGRLGGEEFGIFVAGATAEEALQVAERILFTVGQIEFAPAGTPHRLSVSAGIAVAPEQVDFDRLFRDADRQLYVAKHAGRDRLAMSVLDGDSRGELAA